MRRLKTSKPSSSEGQRRPPQGVPANGQVCRATKRNGDPCTLPAAGSNGFCWAHDPANAQERARSASKAGRSRAGAPATELRALRVKLANLADAVQAGEVSPAVAHAVGALGNVRIRSIEVERKLREVEEIEKRLEAIEARERGMKVRR